MPASGTLFIGIDFGTSGCRGCIIDSDGKVVAEQRLDLPAPTRDGAAVFQQPEIWWQALQRLLGALLETLSTAQRNIVAGLSIDGTSGTVLLADESLRAQDPALMYNDSASRFEAERIDAIAPPASAARGSGSALARLLRLLDDGGEGLRVHSQSDWLLHRLLGRRAAMDSNNALKLGYDPVARAWSAWLDALELPEGLLPQVVPAGTPLGHIDATVAARLGLAEKILICAGTTDSTAAFIAAGANRPGDAVTSLGSTLVLKVLSKRPVFAPEYGVYSQPLGDLWLVGGASNSGGAVLRQFFSDEAMRRLTPELEPERPTGLDYYPLATPGERFPVNDPALQPRLTPRPDDDSRFFQALLEGIAKIEHDGYRLLERLGAPYPSSVRSVGGGAFNPAWTDIRARLLGVPLVAPQHSEACYGSALLARRASDS